jgi:fructose-1,6-bisphosphatase/inositol monophosphatase family enzyme
MSGNSEIPDSDLPISPRVWCDWVAQAGAMALDRWLTHDTWLKGDLTPVTSADTEIEAFLLDHIRRHDPESSILSEEIGFRPGRGPYTWALDPLDGTRAYASGLPIWGISLGLLREGQPCAGVFYLPAVGDMYWSDGETATRNGKPVACSEGLAVDEALAFIAVGSNAHLHYDISYPRLRSLGSTAAHLVYVACSTAIATLTRRVNLWDIAGVLPLLAHCGVQVTYLSGKPFAATPLMSGERMPEPILAARPAIWDTVRGYIHLRTPAVGQGQPG